MQRITDVVGNYGERYTSTRQMCVYGRAKDVIDCETLEAAWPIMDWGAAVLALLSASNLAVHERRLKVVSSKNRLSSSS